MLMPLCHLIIKPNQPFLVKNYFIFASQNEFRKGVPSNQNSEAGKQKAELKSETPSAFI
jgi:hypothetical protein